jgi:hypothetical protein
MAITDGGNFRPLPALRPCRLTPRSGASCGMVLRRRASREGHRSPNQVSRPAPAMGPGTGLNSISAPVTWATVRGECAASTCENEK